MSLKAYAPNVQICLVHDRKAIAQLNEKELSLFDYFSIADPLDYMVDGKPQYQRLKMCVNKYTPFDGSLYIDVDTMWFPGRNVDELIEKLSKHDFYIGKNSEYNPAEKRNQSNYTYWENPEKIAKYFRLQTKLPQTISGVFWFKKTEWTERLFNRCLAIYNDKFAPCRKWANGKPDEYCFNVALSQLGYEQPNLHIVYFDKINGTISRQQMYDNFWGVAAGGNRLIDTVRGLYNDLVNLYEKAFNSGAVRLHVDKVVLIPERRNY